MKINPFTPPTTLFSQAKKEVIKDEPKITTEAYSKQALKKMVQQEVSKMEEARNETGDDNPKVQQIMNKFKNGQKLTAEEMNYMYQNAPGHMDFINRIQRERELTELSMRLAPTKVDVQLVTIRSAKQIEKDPNPETREIRLKHLANAKLEYEQTEEYEEKPNSPMDKEEISPKVFKKKKNELKQLTQTALQAYEKTLAIKDSDKK